MSRKFVQLASLVSTLALSLGMMTASPASADEPAPSVCDTATEPYVATMKELGKNYLNDMEFRMTFTNCSGESFLGLYAEAYDRRRGTIPADDEIYDYVDHGETVTLDWVKYSVAQGKWKFTAYVNFDPDRAVSAGTYMVDDPYAPPPKTKPLPRLSIRVMDCKVRVTLNNRRVEEDTQFKAVFRKKHRTVKRNILVPAESRSMLLQPRRRSRMVVKGFVPGLDSVKRVRVAVPSKPNC